MVAVELNNDQHVQLLHVAMWDKFLDVLQTQHFGMQVCGLRCLSGMCVQIQACRLKLDVNTPLPYMQPWSMLSTISAKSHRQSMDYVHQYQQGLFYQILGYNYYQLLSL